jgi:hypothetical protein
MDPRTKRDLTDEVCTELETHAQLEVRFSTLRCRKRSRSISRSKT